ncbi:hypothetical protein WH96_06295 [Kiloniella spongiae]|uniref:Uncharacterized protein n=1 Tax=Kiloniella spongiae TaxID=1489064 RepID=A0A0H2MMB3_9PROT|nr:hypothetical protein [Kiloniella spongiae]KLN61882.1 hypothetical protein WH96_06295 [Kiloniella spongiae]
MGYGSDRPGGTNEQERDVVGGNGPSDNPGGGGWRHSDPWNDPAPGKERSQSPEAHRSNVRDWQNAMAGQRASALARQRKVRRKSTLDPQYPGVANFGAGIPVEEEGSGAHPKHERKWGGRQTSSGRAAQNMDRRGYHDYLGSVSHKAYQQRLSDYMNEGNTTSENIGNFIGSAFGFNEVKPSFSPRNLSTKASWGFNPFSGIPGAAIGLGLTMANPALGIGYELLRGSTGKRPVGSALSSVAKFGSMVSPLSRVAQGLGFGSMLNGVADEFGWGIDDILGTRKDGWSGFNVGPDVTSPDFKKAKESLKSTSHRSDAIQRGYRGKQNSSLQRDGGRSDFTDVFNRRPEHILYPYIEDDSNSSVIPVKSRVRRAPKLSTLKARRANFGRVR